VEIRTAAPRIPDHEVLRCIGKGSYGEVWLARAVTGTLRAVKVVRREDFELDRTFEREFEGIMKFEPVSREHPGLVHVLHVGRNDEEKFYYYVMELGDDRERGSRVESGDYEPRTLGTDKTIKQRLPVSECIEVGAQVAEGLAHLHECGLTHRDIKPSNIIFVNGKAKLADIGLVAAAGQMTFVGTEGFVPPEGPGTKLADIYSLGMVLYEVSTGKDRLLFPELPDDLGDARTRPQWQALNEIILKACAVQPKKRYPTAREMAVALRAAGRRKAKGGPWVLRLVTLPFVTAAAAFAIVTWQHKGAMPWPPGRFAAKDGIAPPPPAADGRVRIQSDPAGAEILRDGVVLGRTPYTDTVPAGDALYTLRRPKFRDAVLTVTGIQPGQETTPDLVVMQFDDPPRPGQPWDNSLDMLFDPTPDGHISRRAVTYDQLLKVQAFSRGGVARESTRPNEFLPMVFMPMEDVLRFCDELTQRETAAGWLTEDLCYRPEPYTPKNSVEAKKMRDAKPPGQTCFRLVVEKYGSVQITTDPPGAEVIADGIRRGPTPWHTSRQRPGLLEFSLVLPGYQEKKLTGRLPSGGFLPLETKLDESKLAVFGKRWTNGYGVPFRPIDDGLKVLVAAWETRVQDYAVFARETGTPLRTTDADKSGKDAFKQNGSHPVVNVTRADARAFCQWLTSKERAAGFIDGTMEYRLPTDGEWSLAAGLPSLYVNQLTPAERHLSVTGVYPWVVPTDFPPTPSPDKTKLVGNLGDISALNGGVLGNLKPHQSKALEDLRYNDGAVFTAPVGQYAPNNVGLFDLSGNVWEFVDTDYGGGNTPESRAFAVVRGGAWNTPANEPDELATQFRRAIPPDKFDRMYGFRVVLAQIPPPQPPPLPSPADELDDYLD
jgi:formylglycine-generating enzyme required for sulfatase activity